MPLSPQAAARKDQASGNPTFQHRHFAFIAATIKAMPTHASTLRAQQASCALTFAEALESTNPNFDRRRFLAACGME